MSVSRDPTAAATSGVSFDVERFAWAEGRLEIMGRWYGIRGRRFLRPTLDVEVDGRPRRMLALLEHKPWAADDGEAWVAAFEWTGDPVELAAAELAVGPELAVELPAPSGAPVKKARRARAAGKKVTARPPRAQALEAELATARAQIEKLRDSLEAEQRAGERRGEQLEELRAESATASGAAEAARDAAEAERDKAVAARDAALSERDELVAARDAATAERNAAVTAREAALAEAATAAAERDKAVRERAAVETELAAAVNARDKARAERNEWLTRARVAAAPERERQTAPRSGEAAPRRAEPAGEPASPEDRPTVPLPRGGGAAPLGAPAPGAPAPGAPGPASPGVRARRSQIPPGGILLPPSGPGTHMRRSILPGWAPRVLVPILLVVLAVVIALLIAWAF